MNWSLHFLPEVAEEVREARFWYESQRLGLGEDLLEQIGLSLDRIEETPLVTHSSQG